MSVPRWMVALPMEGTAPDADDVAEASTDLTVAAQVIVPPEGLGNPEQAIEDTSYPRRDGTVHYEDWWEPRILTWPDVLVRSGDQCGQTSYERVPEDLRNYAPNPLARNADQLGWGSLALAFNAAANFDLSIVRWLEEGLPDPGLGSPFVFKLESTGDTTGDLARVFTNVALGARSFAPGQQFTVSYYALWPSSNSFQPPGDWWVQAGGPGAFVDVQTTVPHQGNDAWHRYSGTLTASGAATSINDYYIGPGNEMDAAGEAFYFVGMQIEQYGLTGFQPIPVPEVIRRVTTGPDLEVFDAVQDLKYAWRRRQADIEAWLTINGQGPFAVVGRPRVADVDWLNGYADAARMTLRFDAADHRLFVLDVDPETGAVTGDGTRRVTVVPQAPETGRTYDRVYGVVRDHDPLVETAYGKIEGLQVVATNEGTLDAPVTIVFTGLLHQPRLQNLTNDTEVRLTVDVPAGLTNRVTVDTARGSVTVGGASRFGWVEGSPSAFRLAPGPNVLRLVDADPANATGTASVSWRNARL